jgi:hypothetical protein
MTALMGQTLAQKEEIIRALEAELNNEQNRRKTISKDYKTQVKEFEQDQKALESIKREADRMELKQQRKRDKEERKKENELDMVPTKEKAKPPRDKKNQL